MKRKSRAQLEYDLKIALEDYDAVLGRLKTERNYRQQSEDKYDARVHELESILVEDARALGTYEVDDAFMSAYTDVYQYIRDRTAQSADNTRVAEKLNRLDRLYPLVERPENEPEDETNV